MRPSLSQRQHRGPSNGGSVGGPATRPRNRAFAPGAPAPIAVHGSLAPAVVIVGVDGVQAAQRTQPVDRLGGGDLVHPLERVLHRGARGPRRRPTQLLRVRVPLALRRLQQRHRITRQRRIRPSGCLRDRGAQPLTIPVPSLRRVVGGAVRSQRSTRTNTGPVCPAAARTAGWARGTRTTRPSPAASPLRPRAAGPEPAGAPPAQPAAAARRSPAHSSTA